MIPRALRALAVATTAILGVDAQIFKSTTELVTIPLTVTNRNGTERINGLKAADFRVFEDGVEQQVTVLDQERRPLSICIVLDSSTSMAEPRQTAARAVVESTLAALLPDDEVALVVFAKAIQVPIAWTSGASNPRVNWSTYQLVGGTSLNDAMVRAWQLLDTASNARSAILVVSDGGENASRVPLSQLVKTRRQSETLVYGAQPLTPPRVTPAFSGDPLRDGPALPSNMPKPFVTEPDLLGSIVGDSGGALYKVSDSATARAAVTAFFDELRYLYTLGYSPTKAVDGKYRRVKVEARNSSLRVRHRTGYLAMPLQSPP